MDIKDYLYAVRRRLWLPIAIPILAALVTGGVIYQLPERYQATATVVVPAISARGLSTSAVTQYVATFKDVLTSQPVVSQVAIETGAHQQDIRSGLTAATTSAGSNVILVTFTGPVKKQVGPVVRAAAVDAMDILLAPQLYAAQTATTVSQMSLDQANKNLSDFTAATGLLFPDEDYKIKFQELSQLLVQLQQAHLAGDAARVNGLQTIIDARQKDLVALAPQVVAYQSLVQARSSAESAHNKAVSDYNVVNAEVVSDRAPSTVTVQLQGHVSRVPEILRYGGVAAGVALLLSLGYIVFMEFFRPAIAPLAYSGPVGLSDVIPARKAEPDGSEETAAAPFGIAKFRLSKRRTAEEQRHSSADN